jgi:hypothetical protein
MAKVKGPLFSLSASGQIAKTLVYMTWKGIDDVRKYVVPANPNTALQQAQRGYVKSAIEKWHSVDWIALDKTAWNLLATTQAKVMSGFNSFVKLFVETSVAVKTFAECAGCVIVPADVTATVTFQCGLSGVKEATLKYGTSKTAMIESEEQAVAAGVLEFSLAGLVASTKYFCKVVPKDADELAYSGIYEFTTTA